MKTFMITTALALSLSSGVMAGDFDNNQMNFVLERDNLSFGLETVGGEASTLTFGVAVLPHTVLGADADVTFGAEYDIRSEDFTFSATYGLVKDYGKIDVYGDFEAAYTIASGAASGRWEATPTVGASYQVNDRLSAFGDVSYTWDASNDWASVGGEVEVGAAYALSETVSLTPSVVRSFDTGADETNFKLEVGLRF